MFFLARRFVMNWILLVGIMAGVAGMALMSAGDASAAPARPDLVMQAKNGNTLEITNVGSRATNSGFVVLVQNLTNGAVFTENVTQILRPGEHVDINFFACPTFTFRFTADVDNVIRESNERNNVLVTTMNNC